LAARTELEREIKRLKDENAAMKAENRQLRADREEVERQLIDLKTKSDDTITKLRSKIAKLSMGTSHVEGTGKVYPPKNSHVNSHSQTKTARHEAQMMAEMEGFRDPTISELMRRFVNSHIFSLKTLSLTHESLEVAPTFRSLKTAFGRIHCHRPTCLII
jgi:FtsZ-binding cell division protein ZapB